MVSRLYAMRAWLVLAATGLCLVLAPQLGWADPPPTPTGGATTEPGSMDPAAAFARGLELWEAGDHAGAYPLFQRALAVTGSPNARIFVARRLRELGRLPEAYAEMQTTWRDAQAQADQEERYAATRDTAAAEIALLDTLVGKVIVALPAELAGATVVVNDETLTPARIGQPVVVNPGQVRIVATTGDGRRVEHAVAVAAGAIQTVTLSVGETAPPDAPDPTVDEPAQGSWFSAMRVAGIAAGAVGVAGMVVFAIGRVQSDEEIATLEADCGAGPCTDPSYSDVIDRGQQAETMAGIGLGVGIAGLLAGTALILFGEPSAEDAEAAWDLTPQSLRLRF